MKKISGIVLLLFCLNGVVAFAGEPARPDVASLVQPAEKGDAEAQYQLGLRYHYGQDTKKDSAKAFAWWQKSSAQNYAPAQVMLGVANAEGWGIRPDAKEAMKWYQKAADQGYGDAKHLLATIYEFGFDGMPKDHAKALTLWHEALAPLHEAALKGNPDAQCDLGTMYMKGWGVPADSAESLKWRKMAAGQGNPEGEMALAESYRNAVGVPRNDVLAFQWFEKAANHGEMFAQAQLGRSLRDGTGTHKDLLKAYVWLDIATIQGDETAAQDMVHLARSLSFAQYQEAMRHSHAWQEEHIAVP